MTSSREPGSVGIVDHDLQAAVRQLVDVRRRRRQAQQALRRHHDERPRLLNERLAAQQVEVLRGRRDVRDPDVPLGGELQEALDAPARVLGAGTLVAVRQEQREPGRLAPLREARDEELVDHDLRGVHEVAELGLPEHERFGRLDRVAVLEAEAGDLRQRAVVQLERRRCRLEVLDRRVLLAGLGVVQREVAMAEGAALGVLAGQPDRRPLHEERCERERLRLRPVDSAALADRVAPALELRLELAVDAEAGRAPAAAARSASAASRTATAVRGSLLGPVSISNSPVSGPCVIAWRSSACASASAW